MNNKFLIFIALWMVFATGLWAQTATAPSVGDGTSTNPYQIASLENLYWLSQRTGVWSKYFIQTADIDASDTKNWDSGSGFSPIGNANCDFTGNYNGKGHTIKGLYINRTSSDQIGLFGCGDQPATINNLGIINANIKGRDKVGVIVGSSSGFAISNCYSTGSVSGSSYVGGLVGRNLLYSTISNCYFSGSVLGKDYYIGGLAGANMHYCTLSNCYAIGSISGNSTVGGLVGENNVYSTVNNCYFTGSVSANNIKGVLVARNNNKSQISNCYWDKETSGIAIGYGTNINNATTTNLIGLTTAQMKNSANLGNLGDFSTVWAISNNNTYAALRGISNNAPFAFCDNVEITGCTSVLLALNNDYDYEMLQTNLVMQITTLPETGTITNKYYYSFPVGTPTGSQSSFQYRVGEVLAPGDTLWGNTATVVLTKVANTAPSALIDEITITEDNGTITIDALANDSDADNNLISISGIASGYPQHGTAIISNGKIDYTPAADYNGIDIIGYIISDGDLTNTANVIVTITPVNDTPVLTAVTDKSINKGENITLTMADVTASDVDAGTVLQLVIADGENYTVSGNTIIPANGFTGTLSVAISVTDGELTSNQMVMEITVSTSTGIDDNQAATVSAYPNPFTDYVVIESEQLIRRVSFVNLAGQTVLVEEAPTDRIQVGSLKPSIYLVKVEDNNGKTAVLRLVKL